MKDIFRTITGLVFIWFFSSASFATTIFTDNFDSGASPLWGDEQGGWNDSDGVYRSTSGSFAYSSLPTILSDFTIELDINSVWDGGVFLRSEYNGGLFNGISLITGGQGGGGRGVYWHEWINGVHTPILNHSGTLFSSGNNIDLRIDVKGNTYSAYVNGVLATTLTSSLFSSGKVALFNNKLRQDFDNIVISSNVFAVPEPPIIFLLILGLASLFLIKKPSCNTGISKGL